MSKLTLESRMLQERMRQAAAQLQEARARKYPHLLPQTNKIFPEKRS